MALTDEQIYNLLKDLPDFDRFPLPKYFYEKFNIPPPKIQTIREALSLHTKVANAGGAFCKLEVRDPAPGGVRPLIEVKPLEIEVKPNIAIEDALEVDISKESTQTTQTDSDLPK